MSSAEALVMLVSVALIAFGAGFAVGRGSKDGGEW